MSENLSVILSGASAVLSFAVFKVAQSRREKLIDGEAHLIEQAAGVFFCRTAAFFFRNTEIKRRHDDLNFPHQPDNGKDSHCCKQAFSVIRVGQTFKQPVNALRNRSYIAGAAAAAFANINGFRREQDRIEDFHRGDRHIGSGRKGNIGTIVHIERLKSPCFAFAAEQDDSFFENAQAFDSLRTAGPGENIIGAFDEETDIYSIESFVELQRLHIDQRTDNFGFNWFYVDGAVKN